MALLRGVNVGGHRRVPMADLRTGLQAAGLTGVRTCLQSGKAVFDGSPDDESSIAAFVQAVVTSSCGVETDVVARSAEKVADLVRRHDGPMSRCSAPGRLCA